MVSLFLSVAAHVVISRPPGAFCRNTVQAALLYTLGWQLFWLTGSGNRFRAILFYSMQEISIPQTKLKGVHPDLGPYSALCSNADVAARCWHTTSFRSLLLPKPLQCLSLVSMRCFGRLFHPTQPTCGSYPSIGK